MKKTVIILGTIFLFGNVAIASTSGLRIKNQIEFTSYGKSPLHLAISKGDIEAVKKFVIYGADINKQVNNMTPLMVAARFNQFEIINYLLIHKANPSIENSHGFTALDYAEYANSTESIVILKNRKLEGRKSSK